MDQSSQNIISRQSKICGANNSLYNMQLDNNPIIFKLKQSQKIKSNNKDKINRVSLLSDEQSEEFNETINVSSFFAWSILILNSVFWAFVPCWLMGDVKSQSFTRNSWRFTTVSVLLIPFLMYEQRNIKNQNQKFINCLTKANLKPIFISTINYCIWLLILINACRWTSMNHAVCLTDIKLLVVSLLKFKNGQTFHEFQVGGAMISLLGIFLILIDSLTIPQSFDIYSQRYLRIQPWKRLIMGDGLAIIGSFASFYLEKYYQAPVMPRFTHLFIYNIFLTFNLITFGYFFGGSQFSFNTKFGVFGLYTYTNFVSVFYVSIMLGLALIMTNILVKQIFSQLIINVASRFQIILISLIYHVLRLELVPSGLTCLGYSFLVPGLVFILGGQAVLQNQQNTLNFQLYKSQDMPRLTNKQSNKCYRKSETQNNPSNTDPKKPTMPFAQILEQQSIHNISQNYKSNNHQ